MDGLSGAASVMAAVSLTIQLVSTVNTLREFWIEMQNAEDEIAEVIDDLALLNSILHGVKRAYTLHKDPNDADPAHAKSVYLALLRCQRQVNKMTVFVSGLQLGFARKPHRTAFKAAFRKCKIAEFAAHLEQAKLTLLMAVNVTTLLLQNECGRRVQEQFSSLRSDLMIFTADFANSQVVPSRDDSDLHSEPPNYSHHKVPKRSSEIVCSKSRHIAGSDILLWLLQLPPDSPYRKSLAQYGQLVGRIGWQSSTRVMNNSRDGGDTSDCVSLESSSVISIELPIIRRAFTMRSQKSLGQWTHCFRISRIVADNSPIFKICATKDEKVVRKLFDSGVASPFDQTASGVTLLHVAAAGFRCQTYKLLCDAGVEYGPCEDSLHGKITPIELTQNFIILVEGKHQTVQQWLGIIEDQSSVFHPENNYRSVGKIWNQSVETQEEISDAEIITLLQSPLRLPRQTSSSCQVAVGASRTNNSHLRYSPSLLLFCYYFIFEQDPYGCRITNATLSSPALQQKVPLVEYVVQYWDREEWLRLLMQCVELDFIKIVKRQQDKYGAPFFQITWDTGQAKRVRRRTAKISSSDDIHFNVWIGPLEDWIAVFEFEGEEEIDDAESELSTGPLPQVQTMPVSISSAKLISVRATSKLVRYTEHLCLLVLVLLLLSVDSPDIIRTYFYRLSYEPIQNTLLK